MQDFLFALNAIAPIVLFVLLGYILKRIGLLPKPVASQLNKIVFRVFLPIMLALNVYKIELGTTIDFSYILWGIGFLLVLFLVMLWPICRLVPERSQRGVVLQAIFRSNYVKVASLFRVIHEKLSHERQYIRLCDKLVAILFFNTGLPYAAAKSADALRAHEPVKFYLVYPYSKIRKKVYVHYNTIKARRLTENYVVDIRAVHHRQLSWGNAHPYVVRYHINLAVNEIDKFQALMPMSYEGISCLALGKMLLERLVAVH